MNKIVLFAFVTALLAIQACSSKKSHKETSEFVGDGPFSNDPDTKIRSKDKKFLCDFQWTPGYKDWDYGSDADESIGQLGSVKGSWCLIPYGESTEYEIILKDSIEGDGEATHYFCRVINSIYTIANEIEITIKNSSYHKEMKCAELNSDSTIAITAGIYGTSYKDERLYHVISQADNGDYSITGHLDLRLVKPVHLSVLWEPIISGGEIPPKDPDKIKNAWKTYMEKVDDRKLTLPAEKGVLSSKDLAGWFKGSVFNKQSELEYLGAEPDLSRIGQANYVIITTSGYDLSHDAQTKFEGVNGYDTNGFNQCISPYTAAKLLSMVSNSAISNIENSLQLSYYDKNGKFINFGNKNDAGGYIILASEDTKSKCENVAEVRYENFGINAFNIPNGYVLSHKYFYWAGNPGRLLASLLYSAILTISNPINEDDKLWLSSYSENTDIEQPMLYWRDYPPKKRQQQSILPLLEYTYLMQNFKGE